MRRLGNPACYTGDAAIQARRLQAPVHAGQWQAGSRRAVSGGGQIESLECAGGARRIQRRRAARLTQCQAHTVQERTVQGV